MAGSSAALELGRRGMRVALIEKRDKTPEKSLFINGDKKFDPVMLEALSNQGVLIPCPDFLLVNTDYPERGIEVKKGASTYAVFHAPVISYLQAGFSDSVEIIKGNVSGSVEYPDGVEVELKRGRKINASVVVDATGNYSQLSRIHRPEEGKPLLDDDPYVLWVKGVRAKGEFIPGQLIDPIGKDIGLSWVLPYSADYGDIVACDYSRLSEINPMRQQQMLNNLVAICKDRGFAYVNQVETYFSSFIRAVPIPKSATSTRRLYTVGESAGMGSPLMQEVVPTALFWGSRVAEFIVDDKPPADFYNQWRRREQLFPYDLEIAMLRRRIGNQLKGEYGSNAPIYQQILSGFPPEVQRQVLTERKIPTEYMLPFLSKALVDPKFMKTLASLSLELAKVKIENYLG